MKGAAGWIFPLLLGVSLGVHLLLGVHGRFSTSSPPELARQEEVMEITLVEELPPEPEPEILPEPEPEPEPPEPEVEPEPEPEPEIVHEPTPPPAPVPTPRPEPVVVPKAKPKPAPPPKPALRKPSAQPVARIVEAKPEVSRNPPPRYPETARRNKWEGRVLVRARVDANGRVQSVQLARGSGYALLDQAAVSAVRGWRFRPKLINGTPAASVVEVPVNFSLHERR